MSQADAQAPSPQQVRPQPFKSRYKLQGMMAAVVLMWLDFAYVYHGLITGDAAAVSVGMGFMVAAAAAAYYFG